MFNNFRTLPVHILLCWNLYSLGGSSPISVHPFLFTPSAHLCNQGGAKIWVQYKCSYVLINQLILHEPKSAHWVWVSDLNTKAWKGHFPIDLHMNLHIQWLAASSTGDFCNEGVLICYKVDICRDSGSPSTKGNNNRYAIPNGNHPSRLSYFNGCGNCWTLTLPKPHPLSRESGKSLKPISSAI